MNKQTAEGGGPLLVQKLWKNTTKTSILCKAWGEQSQSTKEPSLVYKHPLPPKPSVSFIYAAPAFEHLLNPQKSHGEAGRVHPTAPEERQDHRQLPELCQNGTADARHAVRYRTQTLARTRLQIYWFVLVLSGRSPAGRVLGSPVLWRALLVLVILLHQKQTPHQLCYHITALSVRLQLEVC